MIGTNNLFTKALVGGAMLLAGVFAQAADDAMVDVQAIQHQWETIKYQTPANEQEGKFKTLAEQARTVSEKHKGRAEPLVWEAIVLSTYAGAKGGLGALSLVKKARDLLLEAEKIDANALDGSVYTSLGSLYYQVPGWPVGFGDDKKAKAYLEKALSINPNGIDPNFFYGDFLMEEGEYATALSVFDKAMAAPARPGREVADKGRREEISTLMAKARQKL